MVIYLRHEQHGTKVAISDMEAEADEEEEGGDLVEATRSALPVKTETKEPTDRTDDPVRMYLREMGSVELLSREGEIAIAKRIEAGTVWVNCHHLIDPALPFGGYKHSGLGRENSRAAIEHYTQLKSVYVALRDIDSPY